MGRHRPDPRGHARILIAVAAVALAIALLAVGGIALWGALTSKPAAPSPTRTRADPPASSRAEPSKTVPQSQSAPGGDALIVRCRVTRCGVFISASPGNQVLFNGHLGKGELRQFDELRMNLVVSDGSTVDVYINGKLQRKTLPGERRTYTVVDS